MPAGRSTQKLVYRHLRGLLSQLAQQDDDLLSYVYERCSSLSENKLESSGPLKELLKACLKGSTVTCLVLDGLDECKRGEAEKAALWFTSMLKEAELADSGSIRLLCVSQRDGVLDKFFLELRLSR